MFKNNEKTLNTPAAYVQPVCKCVSLSLGRAVLDGSNGDGRPGSEFNPREDEF